MKKLALKLDDLAVETFATTGTKGRAGTVQGRDATLHCGDDTFYVSCNFTACPLDCETFGCNSQTDCCSQDGSCPGTCNPNTDCTADTNPGCC
jgi:hypothetical protein